MNNLNQTADMLRDHIQELQGKVQTLKSAKSAQKGNLAKKYLKQTKLAYNLLQSYDFEIQDSQGKAGIESHEAQYKQFKTRLEKIEKNIQYNRSAGVSEEELFKHRGGQNGQGGKVKKTQRQQMIELGHKVQKQGLQAVNRIEANVQQMDKIADEVNVQLERQIQKLDSIYDQLQDTQTTLKRVGTHLRYFAVQVYTDKILICLLVLIIIAIIVIIILSIIGKVPSVSTDILPI